MAKRWYEKTAQYKLPAWKTLIFHVDGMYLDGYLFDQNIPILDNTVHITVTPQNWHSFFHEIVFSVPTYQNGVVGFLGARFGWWPTQQHTQSDKIFCSGQPYGMGVNVIGVGCLLIGVISRDIVYDVSYIMEVDI